MQRVQLHTRCAVLKAEGAARNGVAAPQFDECIAAQETGLAMSQALRWPGVGLFAVSRRQITPVIELPAGSSGNFKPMCHSAVGLSAPRQL